jgi:uncharacterized radical SAM protein YgiQ
MASPCTPDPSQFLPTTAAEMKARGWDAVDVVFVSGDAYIDHPSFAAALLGRVLTAEGFRVAILPQPAWQDASAFRQFGKPRLCFAVSAGNMDSMINHYTANKKRRNDDAYSPGGKIELRPDRATNVYAQRCREAFPGTAVIAGGVEASLRRIAHFDYWSETVRPSILVTTKADLVGFGMGERVIVEICKRLAAGQPITATVAICAASRTCSAARSSCPRTNGTMRRATTRPSSCRASRRSPPTRSRSRMRRACCTTRPTRRTAAVSCRSTAIACWSSIRRRSRSTRRAWIASTTCPTRANRTRATRSRSRRTR